jgi:hypothetical protein
MSLNWWVVAELNKDTPSTKKIKEITISYATLSLGILILNILYMYFSQSFQMSLFVLNFLLLINAILGYVITGFISGTSNFSSANKVAITAATFSTCSLLFCIAMFLIKNQTSTDIYNQTTNMSPIQVSNRESRLMKNIVTLYHQTDSTAADLITASQKMLRGKKGAFGGGVYFASSPADTQRKAEHKGKIIKAKVLLGNMKILDKTKTFPDITYQNLLKEGYDSVYSERFQSGSEWVVYNSDQVKNITYL